jgi:hypothetical protein
LQQQWCIQLPAVLILRATVSGNTATVIASGTSTITATQAAGTSHTSGSITATLTVGSGGGIWPCTLPAAASMVKGSSTDAVTTTTDGVVLMGSGTDVDLAMQWMIGKSGNWRCGGAAFCSANAYNSYCLVWAVANSVQTLLIDFTARAITPASARPSNAEMVLLLS